MVKFGVKGQFSSPVYVTGFSKRSHVAIIAFMISSLIEDLFYKLLLVYIASITIL